MTDHEPDAPAGDQVHDLPSADDMNAPFAYDVPAGRGSSSVGFLLDSARRRRVGRNVLSVLTTLLFLAGAGMFTYPFFTDVYTEQVIQQRLEDEFVQIRVDTFDEYREAVQGKTGRALTKIAIPKIGIETLVVEGTSPAALRAGAGHYPNTPLPGQAGNVAIAGHRTTYGRPFNELDVLRPGDEIWLVTPVGDHRYVVSSTPDGWTANPYVTHPKDWQVIAPTSGSTLTLTTCHPKGSAAQRLVVRAELADSHPAETYEQRYGQEA
ncbi:MAG: class E sortase [Nitriliruptorales bacterium]|nr:class E sortase [Nitriliruptorales bacterium]